MKRVNEVIEGIIALFFCALIGGGFIVGSCAHFKPDPIVAPASTEGSISDKEDEWAHDACKKNGGVKRIYFGGRAKCKMNGITAYPPKNLSQGVVK